MKNPLSFLFDDKPKESQISARFAAIANSLNDIKTGQGGGNSGRIESAVKSKPRPSLATLSYNKTSGRSRRSAYSDEGSNYILSPYDLSEIAKVRDIESILQTSIEKHVETALKPYVLEGKDEKKVEYIKRRFWEMEVLSESTMSALFEQIFDQLAAYGTAIVVAKRDAKRSTGQQIKWFKKILDPIATLSVADAPTMCVAENNNGVVVSWKQRLALNSNKSAERTFPGSDVFVIARHRQPGMQFGRPQVISALDDIMTLRRLEELADIIPQKHLFPLFQVQIGTDALPAQDMEMGDGSSQSEVEYARQQISNMPTEGGFVTSHRWKFEMIGAKDEVLDIMPYIEHFKWRVQVGLRMNDTTLGKSGDATKSTATHQQKNMAESAKYLQTLVENGFRIIIRQLLQEGGFDETYEDDVRLNFNDPDTEEQRAKEQHGLSMYQSDLASHDEARKMIGKKPMSEEEKGKTFGAMEHEKAVALAEKGIEGKEKVARVSASARAAKAKTSNKTRPANQSGKKATKTKVKANDNEESLEEIV